MTNMNTTSQLEAELRALLDGVQAEEQRETDEARAAYRDLVFRLARDQRAETDTPVEMHRVAKEAGRSAGQLVADVAEVRELVRMAEEVKRLPDLREADTQAATALRAGQEAYERAVKKAKAKLDALQHERDDASKALYAADDARRALLARLDLAGLYQERLEALTAAQVRLERASAGSDEAADAEQELERRREEVWDVWRRATALDDHSPFRDQDSERNAPPLQSREGFEWKQVNPAA